MAIVTFDDDPPAVDGLGNIDNKELVAGSTLYLPVFADGALFSCGDGHGAQGDGEGARPVEKWHPDFCGDMDMVIKADGSWWHEGSRITRAPLIKLFSTILRKDEDGETYLVTPVEKIKIKVERGHFLATRVDIEGDSDGKTGKGVVEARETTSIILSEPYSSSLSSSTSQTRKVS